MKEEEIAWAPEDPLKEGEIAWVPGDPQKEEEMAWVPGDPPRGGDPPRAPSLRGGDPGRIRGAVAGTWTTGPGGGRRGEEGVTGRPWRSLIMDRSWFFDQVIYIENLALRLVLLARASAEDFF